MPDRDLRLLALDGGGVRGLSALMILQQLMETIDLESPPKPCDYFDIIGGTSTGGLIAIMLGRLKMGIDDCINAYLSLSEQVFQKKRHRVSIKGNIQGRFDSEVLVQAVKEVVTAQGFNADTLLKDESDNACKVFVCATSKETSETVCLTSYRSPRGGSDLLNSVKIWEACRATSAASSFFDPISIGPYGEEFIDGATGANNPIWEVWNQAQLMWGPQPLEGRVKCIVSIGTGIPSIKPFQDDVFHIGDTLVRVSTETEQTAERFRRDKSHLEDSARYYRFNVDRGLEEVGLEESKKRKEIAAATRRYVGSQVMFKQMQACAYKMAGRESALLLQEQQDLTQEIDSLRQSLSFNDIDARKGDIALAYQRTCDWIFKTPTFTAWRTRARPSDHNGVLWIKGKAGAGKSTLMKHTLRHFQKHFNGHHIVSYFFNARGSTLEKTPLGMLRSLLYQLLDDDHHCLKGLMPLYLDKRKKHDASVWQWTVIELQEVLVDLLVEHISKPVVIFIDALDECEEKDVRDVAGFLERLSTLAVNETSSLRICLSSRHYPTITIRKSLTLDLDATTSHSEDIIAYVHGKLNTQDAKIEKELLRKADGVFMWVVLVVELLNREFDAGRTRDMQKRLTEIPSGLDDLFLEILNRDNENRQTTTLILQWVLFAKKILKPEEVYFAVLSGTRYEVGIWDKKQDTAASIGRFITNTSRGLVEIRRSSVQFIHESVKDFLMRRQRLQKLDKSLEQDMIRISHGRLAACCMSYIMVDELSDCLGNLDPGAARYLLNKMFPFLQYAMSYVFHHVEHSPEKSQQRFIERLQNVPAYFTPLQKIFSVWDQETSNRPAPSLLYILADYGVFKLARIGLCSRNCSLNLRCGTYGTALGVAVFRRDDKMIKLFLDSGADINLSGGEYGTALGVAVYQSGTVTTRPRLDPPAQYNISEGDTSIAAHEDGISVVELLFNAGADVNIRGGDYGSALGVAAFNDNYLMVKFLLNAGADVNIPGGDYGTALGAAAYRGHADTVNLLLKAGADVNIKGGHYGTALGAASFHGNPGIVKLLLKAGADVNIEGGHYGTALGAASFYGDSEIVKLLLEAGADVHASKSYFSIALQIATTRGHSQVVNLLREVGGIGE